MYYTDKILIGKSGSGKTTALFRDLLTRVCMTRDKVALILDDGTPLDATTRLFEIASVEFDTGLLEAALLTERLKVYMSNTFDTEGAILKVANGVNVVFLDMRSKPLQNALINIFKDKNTPCEYTCLVTSNMMHQITGSETDILECKLRQKV